MGQRHGLYARLANRHGVSPDFSVRRAKARSLSGLKSHPATVAPAGSNRSGGGGNEAIEAFGVEGHSSDLANMQAVTSSKR